MSDEPIGRHRDSAARPAKAAKVMQTASSGTRRCKRALATGGAIGGSRNGDEKKKIKVARVICLLRNLKLKPKQHVLYRAGQLPLLVVRSGNRATGVGERCYCGLDDARTTLLT